MPEQEPKSFLEFRPSPIHGLGTFAATPIRAGLLLIEYISGQIWIVARREIAPGEELTFNYGYDWEDHREHPCGCGAPECVGYIVAEEFFEKLRQVKPLELRSD